MKIRKPSKKICERFHLTYELKGAQKAVEVLTEYYGVRRMKVVLDGIRVMKGYECDYFNGTAMFTKKGLNRRNVLHELYHHLVESYGLEMADRKEERLAGLFAREVMKKNVTTGESIC